MRFRPRKILIYLLVGIGLVVLLTNLTSYNEKALTEERYLVHDDLQGFRNPRPVFYEEHFKKYAIENDTTQRFTDIHIFQTRGLYELTTMRFRQEATPLFSSTSHDTPVSNGSENEIYREQFLRRVWHGSVQSSVWVASKDRQHEIVDDRIVKQMNFVPKRYRKLMRRGPKGSNPQLELKTIYVPSGVDAETPLGTLKFVNGNCPISACNITTDFIHEKTAHLRLLQADAYFSLSEKKPPGQIWAIWILESPVNTVDYTGPENLVNWTATYRWDSTIVTPYAKFVPFSSEVVSQRTTLRRNYAANKTKLVAWFVSNCNAKNTRLEFVQELKKYIPIDIFGACGTMDCPRSDQSNCNDRLSSEYKFYLSFENSNCDYYITEKFFEIGLSNNVVPIVMGARKADYLKAAPHNSYIYANDFRSAADLADYLLKLNSSDHLYNDYFRWKGSGEFINTKFWCRLCALLHDPQRPDMWYTDFQKWWKHDGSCRAEQWDDSY